MTAFPEDADISAMRRLREGEDLALNEIMERWHRRVTSYLLRFTGNETVAIDLAQETFVRVYQSRKRYRPEAKFSTWLFAIASNLAREHFRWLKRHPTASLNEADEAERPLSERVAADGLNPSEAAENIEQTRAVRDAVMSLPNDLRLFEEGGGDAALPRTRHFAGTIETLAVVKRFRMWHKNCSQLECFPGSFCNFFWPVCSLRFRCVRRRWGKFLFSIATDFSG